MAPGFANRGTAGRLRAVGKTRLVLPTAGMEGARTSGGWPEECGPESMAWYLPPPLDPHSQRRWKEPEGTQWGRESLLEAGSRVSCRPGAPLEGQVAWRSQHLLREGGWEDSMTSKAVCWRSHSAAYPALASAPGMAPASSNPEA